MTLEELLLLLMAATALSYASALSPPPPSSSSSKQLRMDTAAMMLHTSDPSVTRKTAATTTSTTITARRSILATAFSSCLLALTTATTTTTPAAAATTGTGAEVFVGTYSDPINHPGGTRTIRLVGEPVGNYQLAEVVGGGGRGEPQQYILPAVILGGSKSIVIDFSVAPKYGPKDFVGVLDPKTNGIRFIQDGNKWPRVE